MNKVANIASASMRNRVSDAEWETRLDLAACYRLFVRYKMTDLIYTHVTSRVPNTADQILIGAYGLMFDEVTASNLYKIDYDGKVILQPDTPYDINRIGYRLHTAVHIARPDAQCVIHTHTPATVAVSAMKCGLLRLSQPSLRFYNRLSYSKYYSVGFDDEVQAKIVNDLGTNNAMLMRNHGTIVVGRTMAEAFTILYNLEIACQLQVACMNTGAELIEIEPEAAEAGAQLMAPQEASADGILDGQREWSSARRHLDRTDPSYAE